MTDEITSIGAPQTPHSNNDHHQPHSKHNGTTSIHDNTRLADLGYRAELRRDFSALETFGVAFSIM